MAGTVVNQYLDHLTRRNLRPTYRNAQRCTLRRLAEWLHPVSVLDVTAGDLGSYLDSRPLCPASRAVELAHLCGFYRWATLEGHLDRDPSTRLVRPKHHRRLPRPMPDADVRRALREADGRTAAVLALAVYAGLRACEIAQLRASDLDGGMIRIYESKGGSETSVPLSPNLAKILTRADLPATGWLFPKQHGHGRISPSMVCHLANSHLHRLGIDHTLHTLRHAYATALYRETKDLRLVQELLRHKSPATTAVYTALVPGAGAMAVGALAW